MYMLTFVSTIKQSIGILGKHEKLPNKKQLIIHSLIFLHKNQPFSSSEFRILYLF